MQALKNFPIKRAEWITAVLLSGVVLFLLIVRATHAGALWRDECETLQLARMRGLADIIENIQYTSFPIPFVAIVRVYTTLFGTSDVSIRCFGLAVGFAFLCVPLVRSEVQLEKEKLLVMPDRRLLPLTHNDLDLSARGKLQ